MVLIYLILKGNENLSHQTPTETHIFPFQVKMSSYSTPSPLTEASTDAYSTVSDLVTKIGKKGVSISLQIVTSVIYHI